MTDDLTRSGTNGRENVDPNQPEIQPCTPDAGPVLSLEPSTFRMGRESYPLDRKKQAMPKYHDTSYYRGKNNKKRKKRHKREKARWDALASDVTVTYVCVCSTSANCKLHSEI